MRNALERCGYSRSTLGTALDKLKDEIVKKEPGLYAFKVKLKW